MNHFFSVAIDGPAGAGKSTLARRCAEAFHFLYVDTGAIYRVVGLAAGRTGTDRRNAVEMLNLLSEINIDVRYRQDGEQRMLLNGEDVSESIRTSEVSIYASDVSALPEVRSFLMDMQRKFARTYDVIMDGRDIGTVVLPNADLKIFLTASAEVRADRRFRELQEKGVKTDYDAVLKDIRYRDDQDSNRAAAPLRRAADAVLVDTTELTFEESFAVISQLILERRWLLESHSES